MILLFIIFYCFKIDGTGFDYIEFIIILQVVKVFLLFTFPQKSLCSVFKFVTMDTVKVSLEFNFISTAENWKFMFM